MTTVQLIAGRFELGDFIAQGGMGTVYRGQDLQTGLPVAIKLLRPDIATDPENMERFAHEGEMLRTLNHPNIVKLLMAIEDEGKQYLIMEYVVGGSLADLLNRVDHLSVKRSLAIALELADALARAHHLKIIHRDLKPANVLIAEDGTPRLSDFGIARIGVSQLTPHGTILGTLAYVPPETFSHGPIDTRGDIWAFGVTLFEMLTGQKPFNAHTSEALIGAILHQPTPDLVAMCPTAPIDLVDLVYRMLEKDPRRRIGSMRHIAADLETIQNSITDNVSATQYPLPPIASVLKDEPLAETAVTAAAPNPTPITDNLPSQMTPFVGRETELRELTNLLADPAVRLITIFGPGGMGKTRLALETAATHKSEYPHGVFFIPLAPLTDPEAILAAIADAVNIEFIPGSTPRQQLINFFRLKTMLLIFDNFEHILAGTGLVSDILQAAPGVKLIATSREILNLRAETLYRIEGLDFPDSDTPDDTAGNSAAVQLFVQTARRVRPSFMLKTEYDAVIRICQLVDGMPLGIELAAALVRRKTCRDIAARIGASLDALNIVWQDIPERHRSMRAVFEYSWNLLAADEQAVFQKLWVFHGAFSLEAAEAVAGATETSLFGLVDKSMVNEIRIGHYELHSLLRQYSEEKLGGPAAHTDERRTLLSQAANYFHAQSKPASECKTVADLDSQLAEFGYRIQLEEYNTAADLLFTFDRYLGGLWGQYELVITMHESLQGKLTDPALNRASLNNLGLSLIEISQVSRGITYLQELFENAHASNDVKYELSALINLGVANAKLGRFQAAIDFLNQALSLQPSEAWRLTIIANIAEAYFGLGEYNDALRNYDQIIATQTKLNSQNLGLLRCLGQVQIVRQDFEAATKTLSEAIDLASKDGALTTLREARINRTALHLFKDDLIAARQEIKLAQNPQVSQDVCRVAVLEGLTAACVGESVAAKKAAARAIALADDLLKKTPDLYEENYIRALAHAILVSVGDGDLTAAHDAYHAALLHCNAAGIVAWNASLLDVLIKYSRHEKLASLRTLLATA